MSIRLLIGLSFILGTQMYAQHTQRIEGHVIDAHTLRPLAGVTLVGHKAYAVSDETGAFVLKTVGDSAVFSVFLFSRVGF